MTEKLKPCPNCGAKAKLEKMGYEFVIGFLEGFSACAWAQVGPKLADEFMDQYDTSVDTLRKAITDETEERR